MALLPSGDLNDCVALVAQQVAHEAAYGRIVFDEQDGMPGGERTNW